MGVEETRVIKVEDFHKAYEQSIAVRGLNFQVAPGEILGLIGPNGAGKTTTLRTLAGIIPASRGRLSVGEFDIREAPLEAKRRLAYIPDEPQLFTDLTVDQHLAFAAAAIGSMMQSAALRACCRTSSSNQNGTRRSVTCRAA
jgi:ABC-2 type transport system ATP-binding protein